MRASHWQRSQTDIVPICLSARSAEVHLARPNTPGRARPRAPLGLVGQVMATTTLVAPEYASPVAGTSDAWYDLRSQGPQSLVLIASSAAGYTSVPLVSTCAPGVSFAGSILPLPMMCMTGTPWANR